jgi:hypothetical protein
VAQRGPGHLAKRGDDLVAPDAHARRRHLHDDHVAVTIDDEAGQAVGLGVDESERLGADEQRVRGAPRRRCGKALGDQALPGLLLAPRQHPHADVRVGGEVAEAERLALAAHHAHPVARAGPAFDPVHRAGEHPGVAPAHRPVAATAKDDVGHEASLACIGGNVPSLFTFSALASARM